MQLELTEVTGRGHFAHSFDASVWKESGEEISNNGG
jgi:hypothetical protein